jgi:tetratricopeptide (TPR) repeat protein
VTQEFHLSVTPIGGDDYLVRTERRAIGVPIAEEQVTWPVEEWLAQANLLMNDPLQGLLRGDTLHSLPLPAGQAAGNSENLVRLGQALYNALFQRSVRDSWTIAQGIAQHRREILRLRLGLKDSRLPRLPWEVLHAGDRPVSTGTDVLFSRYHSSFAAATFQFDEILAVDPDKPLRILIVLSAPTDQDVLALKQEAQNLQEELQRSGRTRFGQTTAIDLTILDQPDREELTQTLEHNHYHVFHYAGHSNLGVSGGNLYLVSRKTGLTEILNGDDLAGLLVNNGIRMAVFNSCRGVYTPGQDEGKTGNLAEALVKRNIPAVLAMAERIPDAVALTLSRLFYRNLKQAYPIDLSLSRARQGLISSYGSNQLYWALPILYLHPQFDGCLRASGLEEADELAAIELQSEPMPEPIAAGVRTGLNGRVIDAGIPGYGADDYAAMATEEGYASFDPDDQEFEDPEHVLETTIADLVNELSRPRVAEFVDEPFYPAAEARQAPSQSEPAKPFSEALSLELPPDAASASTLPTKLETPTSSPGDDFYPDLEQMLASAGKLTDTLAAGFRAVRTAPQAAETHHALGWSLHQQGYLMEAIAAYNQALRLKPDLAIAHGHLGFAQMQQGVHDKAQRSLQRAIDLNPDLSDAQRHLEIVQRKLSHASTGSATIRAAGSERSTHAVAEVNLQPGGVATVAPPAPPEAAMPESPRNLGLWAGVVTILIGGFLVGWLAYTQLKRPLPEASAPTDVTSDLGKLSASALAAKATEQLNQGDLNAAQASIKALLDQGALAETKQVLATVPSRYADSSSIDFLIGRHAWQSYKAGDPSYKAADAWRAWERASKQPNPEQQNALGFAYYEDNRADLANQAWQRTPELLGQQGGTTSTPSTDLLTAYAGTALSLMQLAAANPSKRSSLLSEALRLRQQVLERDAARFQPEALAQNWLWSAKAIQDWRSLLATQASDSPEASRPAEAEN